MKGTPTTAKKMPDFKTNRWLKNLYNELNKDFFGGKLPKNIRVIWSEDVQHGVMGKTMWFNSTVTGDMVPYEIRIPIRMRKLYLQRSVGMTMVHEMNHIKCGFEVPCEEFGGKFDDSMFELCKKGAFQTFW